MTTEVSIIIISYNIFPQIKFTLYSLENKHIPLLRWRLSSLMIVQRTGPSL